jgi:cell division protein FtsB
MSEQNTELTTDQTVNSGDSQADTTTEKVEVTKTFTQEDVNNIATKEARKAQEKVFKELGIEDFENAKEGFQKFQEWQESQKTESDKQAEQLKALEGERETLSSENDHLKSQISAMKQGVKAESVEDVVALAERRVNDETTIDEAIKQVVEEYPHFSGQEETPNPTPQIVTPGNPNGGNNQDGDPFAAKLAKYN